MFFGVIKIIKIMPSEVISFVNSIYEFIQSLIIGLQKLFPIISYKFLDYNLDYDLNYILEILQNSINGGVLWLNFY